MLELISDLWPALVALCRDHATKRIDILTGFIGRGASKALAELGVQARIVMGLPSEDACLSQGQIDELRALAGRHDVRWQPGLHAKMYLLDERVVLIGSANFTRAGFELLDELTLATDDPGVVGEAVAAFHSRFERATPVQPELLQAAPAASPGEADGAQPGLGFAWDDRRSGFSSTPPVQTAGSLVVPSGLLETEHHDDAGVVINFDGNDFMYMNVAEGPHRCWADCRRYGFLAAGQHAKWSNQLSRLRIGAPVYAYMKGLGYVGLGIVDGEPRMASEHVVTALGKKLFDLPLATNLRENADDPFYCEWLVPIRWYRTFSSAEAVGYGLFSSQHVCCRLRDAGTLSVLRAAFEPTHRGEPS